jgi:hypothetical protein
MPAIEHRYMQRLRGLAGLTPIQPLVTPPPQPNGKPFNIAAGHQNGKTGVLEWS